MDFRGPNADSVSMLMKSSYFEFIINTMSEGYIIQDSNATIIECNEAALKIMGFRDEEIIGKTTIDEWADCIYEDGSIFKYEDHPCIKLLKTGKAQNHVIMGIRRRATGEVKWVKLNTVSFDHLIDGSPKGVLTTCTDVTDIIVKKRDKEILDRQLLDVQTVGKIGSFLFDYPTKKSIWTEEMYRIFDMPLNTNPDFAEIVKKVIPEDVHIIEGGFEKAERYGSYTQKFRILKKDRICWVSVHAKARNSESGKLLEIQGVAQDITEQVQLEVENSHILHSLNLGLWRWDMKTEKVVWDDKMFEIYGRKRSCFDNNRMTWVDFLHTEDSERVLGDLKISQDSRKPYESFFRVYTEDGSIRSIGAKGSIIYDENGAASVMYGLCWDRTKEITLENEIELEKAKAHQSAKLALVGEMAGGVAHEINTPLAIINGTVKMIKMGLKRETLSKEDLLNELNGIESTVIRISKIVAGLRNLSRDSSAESPTRFILKEVISDISSICQEKFKSHGVVFEMNDNDPVYNLPMELRRIQISQVLLNLISNAYDAIEDLQLKWIKLDASSTPSGIQIRIMDSGPGISEALQQKIFNPFFTTKQIGKGTGLGLSLSKTLVEKNGGELFIDNNSAFTCFVIHLPYEIKD